ncbi:MAG TPA: hypothetical protein VFM01_09440 [Nakamurella sp.]|nr:hypothetical protein [Nakamurella sp.]
MAAPLTVDIAEPVLIYGERDRVAGEVWLTNNSGADITVNGASLTVDFPTPETGAIPLPNNTAIAVGASRRLAIQSGMPVFTPGGTYNASIDLETTAGPQSIAASVFIADTYLAEVVPTVMTFTGVTKSATLAGTVLVVNRGNTPIDVGAIPDETLLEMVTIPRVVEISAATLSVQPAPAMVTGGTVTFSNPVTVVAPGTWRPVPVKLTMPATITANRHFRVLPRIATQRFVVDLLT